MTIDDELRKIDRQISQAYREHRKYSGAIPQTEEERHLWPKKASDALERLSRLETERLELSDRLTASIGS